MPTTQGSRGENILHSLYQMGIYLNLHQKKSYLSNKQNVKLGCKSSVCPKNCWQST